MPTSRPSFQSNAMNPGPGGGLVAWMVVRPGVRGASVGWRLRALAVGAVVVARRVAGTSGAVARWPLPCDAGAVLGTLLARALPGWGLDPRVAGLVGMAAMFAGASHALLASVVFAVESTHQTAALVPLLAGCTAAYLVARLMSPTSIMTEKLVRRGTRVSVDYVTDVLDQIYVRDIATPNPVSLRASQAVEDVRDWIAAREPGSAHQGFPVLDEAGRLVGVVTRRDLLDLDLPVTARVVDLAKAPAVGAFDDMPARQAATRMVRAGVGRLPVVRRDAPGGGVGLPPCMSINPGPSGQDFMPDAIRRVPPLRGPPPPAA